MPEAVIGGPTADRSAGPALLPRPSGGGRRLGLRARLVVAALVGLVVAAGLCGTLRLLDGPAVGAGDNSDGGRLFCAAGLTPDATGQRSNWRGVVVTEFDTGGEQCPPEASTTSAAVILQAAVGLAQFVDDDDADGTSRFSLRWLAALYALLIGMGAALAAFASTARSPAGLAVLVPPLLPLLAVPWWSRFLVSTYGESAGLLGAAWVSLGLAAVAVTRSRDRGPRWCALVLLATGGIVACTAKAAFLPVGIVAVGACALTAVGGAGSSLARRRAPGVPVAVAVVAVTAAPLASAARAQEEFYLLNNVHDLVFTAVLPEAGPAATAALGLRPAAAEHAGEGYYYDTGAGVPGYAETVAARPEQLREAVYRYLATHPRVPATMVHRGLMATALPQLPYLPSTGGGPGTVTSDPLELDADRWLLMGALFADLDALPAPSLPAGVVAVALAAGAATVVVPRARRPISAPGAVAVGLVRCAAALALTGLGIVTLAVLGDGYYELTKHVWLASYALVVAAGALVAAGAVAAMACRAEPPPAET